MADGAADDDAGAGCAALPARDLCATLPALPEDPKLDGELDCGAALAPLPTTGWTAALAIPEGQRAEYAVAWRPHGLYFYIRVFDARTLSALPSDDDPACGDGVDLYVAPASDRAVLLLSASAERGRDAVYDPATSERLRDFAAASHGVWTSRDGYVFEAFVTSEELAAEPLQLTSGNNIAFDIALNVSVDSPSARDQAECGYRLGRYFLRVATEACDARACEPGQSPLAPCTPVLLPVRQ